ncbi:aminotransferase class III-fold pyridoxal phosphate-dependent enzyme [Aureisphaera galaxeae]|uniref:aminotransferase class III-fold pyridoxal phosphate-dependent enzyme n=1 Tax=Aureisphaera galaxeae TaxID=1538023 RepID=UPI002350EB27|nr:aminotransferase class III-fold pyridoxal phosphate-dependent enzyme [Aureisphaera galaxeae]MDC8002892.1 aminotransferase class III-fold pyridoxal phosphate-dependent enzyme [Aureisphaera galaxeae]
MNYQALKISPTQAEGILLSLYGLSGSAKPLPGERDFNFRIRTEEGPGYILKVSRPEEDLELLDFQQQLLLHLENQSSNLVAPRVIKDKENRIIASYHDDQGNLRYVRLLSWIEGRLWSGVNPHLDSLRQELGALCGKLTTTLSGFDHSMGQRDFEWDVAQSLWTKDHLALFGPTEREIVSFFQERFESTYPDYENLRKGIVHNDANDNNVVVSEDLLNPQVIAAIDYGDAIHTQTINDLAIACAYGIMGTNNPLEAALSIVSGYHSEFPLQEKELKFLYDCIAMRLIISVTKSAMNKVTEPDNEYLLVSEKPAWDVLKKWHETHPDFAHQTFRSACGLHPHPNEQAFKDWATQQQFSLADLFPTMNRIEAHHLDLSVSSTWTGHQEEFNNLDYFQFKIDQLQKEVPDQIIAGGYLEPRALYTSSTYGRMGNRGPENRTIHLGIDFWLPEETAIHALFDGEVVIAVNDEGDKEYGGLVVLKHRFEDHEFYTLYGHLTVASATWHNVGDTIKKGDRIAYLGNYPENGNWAPHLHFQVMLSLFGYTTDFPGVAYYSELDIWKSICPNPNLLFKSKALESASKTTNEDLIDYRKQHLGKSLSLQYKKPIKMVRGAGQYLMDQHGRKYLDTVNNVAHVGHEHFEVVKAGQRQMALLNTNSRYLHENINALAQELLETLPPELSVMHFVNSGSEANELAIRMVKAATGQRDIIASEVGYHGNANMCIDISSYKFDGKGGKGAPEHTHIIPLPDTFRGKYRDEDAAGMYAEEVQKQIETIENKGRKVGAFIIEPIISCGGQVELPEGFLASAYDRVRAAGGLCISDEVQTGCGRMGSTFWGFQLHDVVPDIVTIGKPLGNGHPVAAVACTQEVAEKFANGMEYFNTFGGNPVSCAIAATVLRTVKQEKLQENALNVGNYLKEGLKKLAEEHPIIGDVRGQGLFLGIELVNAHLHPLADQTDYLANRMKEHGILMSTDGPDHNVLKIKPPLVFNLENAESLLFFLKKILSEDFMQV